MRTSWLCATLLPLFLFSCALPEKQCLTEADDPLIKWVDVNSSVSVRCPDFTAELMTFMLYKDKTELGSVEYKNISSVSSIKHNIKHIVNNSDNTTHFVLFDVDTGMSGLYKCTAERIFPPPLVKITEEPQTIVIVKDHKCPQNGYITGTPDSLLPIWLGFGALSIYGLAITCIALTLKFRLKRECMASHDYMNMKPRTRRKKQGIHHPTHLSWYNDANNGKTVSKKLPS